MTRHPEAIVIKIKGVRSGEVFRSIIDDIIAKASDWTGPATCVPVFKMSQLRPDQYEDVVWEGLIPHDTDGIEQLLLASDEIDSIQHKRNFLPNEKPKPKVKKKPTPKGPFSKRGYDLSKWPEIHHQYFDLPELTIEGQELKRLLDGFPFRDRSPVENARYIEIEIIHRLRDRFPTIYDLNRLNQNAVVEALKLMSKPEIQKFGRSDDFNIFICFHEYQIPNMIKSFLLGLQTLDWMIRTDRLKDRDRKIVDPTDDEAAEDKLFHIHAVGRGVTSDRALEDDLADNEEMAAADAAEGIY